VSYELLLELFKFTKEYKYTLGESIKKEIIEMIVNIYRANSRQDKLPYISKARESIEVVRIFLRLLKDLKQVNTKKFALLNDKCESVSKQLVAWLETISLKILYVLYHSILFKGRFLPQHLKIE
jgi:hypothetical protein